MTNTNPTRDTLDAAVEKAQGDVMYAVGGFVYVSEVKRRLACLIAAVTARARYDALTEARERVERRPQCVSCRTQFREVVDAMREGA